MIRIKLAEMLGKHKLRISDLAGKDIGIHPNTLYRLYNEESKRVDFEVLEKLCDFFNCRLDELIEYDPDYIRPSSK
jgi:putative transcriptional regulator